MEKHQLDNASIAYFIQKTHTTSNFIATIYYISFFNPFTQSFCVIFPVGWFVDLIVRNIFSWKEGFRNTGVPYWESPGR